jgi:CheY-like chemotaxis protein
VVVCDLGLPGMSGHAVCQELRKAPAFAAALIVALSGHGSDGDQDECKRSGFDHHLLKPVDPQRVAALIASATPR